MTEREVLSEKVKVFSIEECIDKLIEELEEALSEAIYLRDSFNRKARKEFINAAIKRLMEELADVEVAGKKTFFRLRPLAQWWYTCKIHHAITIQIPEAIAEKIKSKEE